MLCGEHLCMLGGVKFSGSNGVCVCVGGGGFFAVELLFRRVLSHVRHFILKGNTVRAV